MSRLDAGKNIKVIDGAIAFLEIDEYSIVPDEDDIVVDQALFYAKDDGNGKTLLSFTDKSGNSSYFALNGEIFASANFSEVAFVASPFSPFVE